MEKSVRISKIHFGLTLSLLSLFFLSSCTFSGKITSIQASSSSIEGLSVSDKVVPEYGIASLTVSLTKASSTNVSFTYYTQNISAASGTDYTGVSGAATIPAGETQVVIPVSIISNLTKASNKSFYFNISNASNSTLLSASSIVQIQDDDFNPLSGVAVISMAGQQSCALTNSGSVKVWGTSFIGDFSFPTDVPGLSSAVSDLKCGGGGGCILTTAGGVKCWGYNDKGQLGDGTTTNSTSPVDVVGLTSGVAAISVGVQHACALTTGGGMKCWGDNTNGRLGDGTITQRNSPVDVSGLTSGVASISAGFEHSCAVTTGGGAKCWGRNGFGQLGDSSLTQRLTPVDVTGLTSGVSLVAAGYYQSCALTTTGGAKCWGSGTWGTIGDSSNSNRTSPANVTGLASGVTAISMGYDVVCALVSGGLKCWGSNISGYLGDGSYLNNKNSPMNIPGLSSGIIAVSIGNQHTCVLNSASQVLCWGPNDNGQLGIGKSSYNEVNPVDPVGLTSGMAAMSFGFRHACALTTAGGVQCWGDNYLGTLGDGTNLIRGSAVSVTGLSSGVAAVSTGYSHSCALTAVGGVKCWGANSDGRVGDGTTTNRNVPVDVSGLTSGVSAISAGNSHTCALTTSGGVKCWGQNIYGQIGDGSTTQRNSPVDVSGLTSGVSAISAGSSYTCALTTSGGVKCWGENGFGQLGDGTATNSLAPVNVGGLSAGVISVTAGWNHVCALMTSGTVKCWGETGCDGFGTQRNSPVDVAGIGATVTSISAGNAVTYAMTSAGSVKNWGWGTPAKDTSSSLASGITKVFAGSSSACALTTGGGLKCLGDNQWGQLGFSYIPMTPVSVLSR